MAFNPSPKVAAARDFAKKFDQEMVIIFHIDRTGSIGYASYGRDQKKCDAAHQLAKDIFESLTEERACDQ